MLSYILAFAASATVVVGAGSLLMRSADAIAERTGLGRMWTGAVMLAAATSLPELATDLSAVRMGTPNLAVGDLFGSSLANMLILAVIDQFAGRGSVLRGAALENALTACLAIVLNALGVLFILIGAHWALAGISPASALLLLVYLGGTRAVYRSGLRLAETSRARAAERKGAAARDLRTAIAAFVGAASAIVVAAPALAWSARHIAESSGLGTTFVGTWLLGLCTSLPEFVTSFFAARMGAFDLAVGNLFGSNSFNMVVFVALDLANPSGPIFGALSADHALTGVLAIILMGLGLASIVYRAERRFLMIEPDSLLIITAYVAAVCLSYRHSQWAK
jgi:cation:H+ antiporter